MALRGHEVSRVELDGKVAERDSTIHERDALIMLPRSGRYSSELNERSSPAAAGSRSVSTIELAESERARAIAEIHERELRSMMTGHAGCPIAS